MQLRPFYRALVITALFVSLAGSNAFAQGQPAATPEKPAPATQPAAPKVGDDAPALELKAADGKTHRLLDYKDKIVVLEWLNQDCPVSRAALPKVMKTSAKYAPKGVVWLAIDSTHYQTAEKDAKYAADNKIPHPILLDADGTIGHRYGARVTPHLFIIKGGKLVYIGAFDSEAGKSDPKSEYRGYVDEALEALLAGKPVPVATTDARGCTVKYKK